MNLSFIKCYKNCTFITTSLCVYDISPAICSCILSHCFSATGIESFYYTQSKIHCWSRSGDKTSHTEKQLPVFPRPKINNSYPPLLRPRPWPEWSAQ